MNVFHYFNTDVPDAVMITTTYNNASGSLLVQWNEVTDYFTVNYTVTWYDESGIVGMVTVNSPPYTVTGLTANTSYNVTVVAINTCCGAGPVGNVTRAMTNVREPIPQPTTGNVNVYSYIQLYVQLQRDVPLYVSLY